MKYEIVAVGDIHWGALDADKQRLELSIIPEYLEQHDIDLLVICGDYFDHKLMLNSQASLQSVDFMSQLIQLSHRKGHEFKIRVFDGTRSHDYDQLEVFQPFDDGDIFRLFRQNTFEETLPGLKCLYAPDENIDNSEYYTLYNDNIFVNDGDIMFFHGNFDNMLGGLLVNDETEQAHNVVFEYDVFSRLYNVMIGGHWHDADNIGKMYYTRSVNRWKFGEDRPKGFIHCVYNTDDRTYDIERINNPYTDEYRTFLIDTSLFTSINDYNTMMQEIDKSLQDDDTLHVKIKVVITNDSSDNKTFLDSIRLKYSNNRRVKVSTENKFTKKIKKEKTEKLSTIKDKYSFLFNSQIGLVDRFIQFVKITKGIDLEPEQVKPMLEKYMTD